MDHNFEVLDNPVWYALQTVHEKFASGVDQLKRYHGGTLQMIGCEKPSHTHLNDLEPWLESGEKLFVVGECPQLPGNWSLLSQLDCVQMICQALVPAALKTKAEVLMLEEKDHREIFELVDLVQPGYFHVNTPALGDYFGIKQDGHLVALAGERLRMTGFTEISAVVTHPSCTGKGFAQQLVSHLVNKNLSDNHLPFLHFRADNLRARKVYELLGFKERKMMPFRQLSYTVSK